MELDMSSDGNAEAADEDGDGYFGCQLELFGEAVPGRRTRVIQKRWRPDKTFSIGREQFATSSTFHRIGLDRISRQHFEIRCGRAPETHAGRSAKRKRHASSTKRCFFLKDLSGALYLPRVPIYIRLVSNASVLSTSMLPRTQRMAHTSTMNCWAKA